MESEGGEFAGDELVPTETTDFSPYILKIRQAQPDLVVSNLAGNQITNFIKQYAEFGLPFPLAGFGFDTVVAWGAGEGAFSGIWPIVWHHLGRGAGRAGLRGGVPRGPRTAPRQPVLGRLQRAEDHRPRHGGDAVGTDSTETLRVPALGRRVRRPQGPSRLPSAPYDNQMVQEMYAVRGKEASTRWRTSFDIYEPLGVVPEEGADLEVLAPEKDRHLRDDRLAPAHPRDASGAPGQPDRGLHHLPAPHTASRGRARVQIVFLLEQVLNGLLVGAYYLLIALGLSLIFSLGGIVNLAHGAFYAIGAYLAVVIAP